jgi:hypothetical protein
MRILFGFRHPRKGQVKPTFDVRRSALALTFRSPRASLRRRRERRPGTHARRSVFSVRDDLAVSEFPGKLAPKARAPTRDPALHREEATLASLD